MKTPLSECRSCRRLVHHLKRIAKDHPEWHNAPVPAMGPPDAPLLILGLAPGRTGANRTGMPFVGDKSSVWLQERLRAHNCVDDNGFPTGVRISNAVKCLPPGNKPTTQEIKLCGKRWLSDEFKDVRAVLALGKIAHDAVLRILQQPLSSHRFTHGAEHHLGNFVMVDSFHPSPLNTATGRLSPAQFDAALSLALSVAKPTH